jgi:hypothetical protein
MDILISDNQFYDVCLKESCVVKLTSLLNDVSTKKIFRDSVDNMLDRHKKYLSPESKQYKKDADILKKYFNFSDERISKTMRIKLVYDEDNNWVPINKLNTNYSDLSVLVTDILVGEEECICKLVEDLKKGNTLFLSDLVDKINNDPEEYYQKYVKGNFEKYVENNRKNTRLGDESELFAISEMEKLGYKLIYLTSEGSPIDMKFSVDAIMEKNREIYKIQVKTVGSLTNIPVTPCDISNPGVKKQGGVKVFKKNRIDVNEQYVDYLIFIVPKSKKMLVLKKFQPISIESTIPLWCVAKPINQFPKNNTYIDHESIIYQNF